MGIEIYMLSADEYAAEELVREEIPDKYLYNDKEEPIVASTFFDHTWIEETGRQNTMDEYGMLLDFIGHVRQNLDRKYLLLVVRSSAYFPPP